MTNDFDLQILCVKQPEEPENSVDTRYVHFRRDCFILYESTNRWSLSLGLKNPGPWSSLLKSLGAQYSYVISFTLNLDAVQESICNINRKESGVLRTYMDPSDQFCVKNMAALLYDHSFSWDRVELNIIYNVKTNKLYKTL